MGMDNFDHNNTMVLLIGTSHYPMDASIESIPNVAVNLQLLKTTLQDTNVMGIPEENIIVSLNENGNAIEKKLRDIAEKTRQKKYTLLVYYSGHAIFSSIDYKLYLTTSETSKQDLEIDGISIDSFKKYIQRSVAGRKVIILDCCHSGALINTMNDLQSGIQSALKSIEGTYIMTSAAQQSYSLFPISEPGKPTFFTGKFIDTLNTGLKQDEEYFTLKDVFFKIDGDFAQLKLPRPQQYNFNSIDKFPFFRNKNYVPPKTEEETEWETAIKANTIWGYFEFRRKFPASNFAQLAKEKIYELEEDDSWQKVAGINTVYALDLHLEKFPYGKHREEALEKLELLKKEPGSYFTTQQVEERLTIKKQSLILDKRFLVLVVIAVVIVLLLTVIFIVIVPRSRPMSSPGEQVVVDSAHISDLSQADSLFLIKDYAGALALYRANMERLSPGQQFNLSEIYENYNGGIDLKKALYWNKIAAEAGHADAMSKLGDKYYTGIPQLLNENKDSAFYWYQGSAYKGNVNAMQNLSQMYRTGIGVVGKDFNKADYWYLRSHEFKK